MEGKRGNYFYGIYGADATISKANGDNPVQQAIDALKSHGNRVDDFYDEFQEYKDMEDM